MAKEAKVRPRIDRKVQNNDLRLYTIEETAAILGISRVRLFEEVVASENNLDGLRITLCGDESNVRNYRFSHENIRAWQKKNERMYADVG